MGEAIDANNIGQALAFLDMLPIRYECRAIRAALRRDHNLFATPEFIQWVLANFDRIDPELDR